MAEAELSPCHNLTFRAVPLFVVDAAGKALQIGHAFTCGKDGWMNDQRVECWKVYGVKQLKGQWPSDLRALEVRDLVDGNTPIYRHDSGYFLERNMLGLYELVTNTRRQMPAVDVKAAAAGDVVAPEVEEADTREEVFE